MNGQQRLRPVSIVLLLAAVAFPLLIGFFVIGAPEGWVGYRTAFDTLRRLAWIGSAAAIVSALLVIFSARLGISRISGIVATLLFAVPVLVMSANEASAPPGMPINDITTDLEDPPIFSAVIPLRPAGSNPIEYGGPEVAARQREAYPNVQPLMTELDIDTAFQRAFETGESLGWEIVSGDKQAWTIEAVDTTTFFRFKDDIVIRLRAHDSGTRIDLRSRSRVGRSDLGKNAKRIQTFIREFQK